MKIRRAYKYRIYPNKQQQQELAVQFGHARFIFNYGLDVRKQAFKETGKGLSYTATALLLPKLKQDLPWLKEADSQVLQQKLKDLDTAYVNFFKGRAGYPTFKNKNSHQSIRYPQRFKLTDSQIYLPKVGWVTVVLHRPTEGVPKNATVSKTKSGKYFVSVQCELEIKLSNRLVRSHGTVSLENLNVAGMVKCHSLAKSISDSGWNTLNICNFNTVGATELQACGEDVRPTTFLGGRLTSVKQEAQCL